ncbi:CDP-diacylglycerol--glycerol-3-phosphate 3-phosphatidyltransferase, mitochondrial isoform X2 [Prorops nasuta]|uniref:CDP-diacylglycerol--glycerol-3-phosphate 3-phosphatidyltransferase, mitochondrial isoform X2 n=1 Tax=Prorops nasuta TaxID=863751 RepID=UPI0034D0012A
MHTLMRIIFKKLPASLSTAIKEKINLHPNLVPLTSSKYKTDMGVVEEDRLLESEIFNVQTNDFSWLKSAAPTFSVNGANIRIIHEPSEFYNILIEKCKFAKERITFASLYLGTGKLESELVIIGESIANSNKNLKVTILLDYIRGSRGSPNSRDMLQSLTKGELANNCQILLYHTPRLYEIFKKFIPGRCNELIGLQHMKVYLIDNCLIISGANLSDDYFVNRQDRYYIIEDCKELCNFYDQLIQKVGEFSFLLQADGSTKLNPSMDFSWPRKKFIKDASQKIKTLFQNEMMRQIEPESRTGADTLVFPIVQMGQLSIFHENEIILKLLRSAPAGGELRIGTGYFNLTSEYCNALLQDCQADCHLLTAHPTANGFFKSKGIAGGIPAAYTKIEEGFYKMCENKKQGDRITLWEYAKAGWTYHAKGIWYKMPNQMKPSLTVIGSSNFGYRSVRRDLETQIVILTKNKKLQDDMQTEYDRLFANANLVTRKIFSQRDRRPPIWVCATVFLFRHFF